MKIVATLLAMLTWAPVGTPQFADLIGHWFTARVNTIVDGDTIYVVPKGENRSIRIRLLGVDAPERGEPFSKAAAEALRMMVGDRTVEAEGHARDKFGRLVARVTVDGRDVAAALAVRGLVCYLPEFSVDAVIRDAVTEAKHRGTGFWSNAAQKPRCASRVGPKPVVGTSQGDLHGNGASRVYHRSSCRNYSCNNCTVIFRSEADAKAAGFRPAGDCIK